MIKPSIKLLNSVLLLAGLGITIGLLRIFFTELNLVTVLSTVWLMAMAVFICIVLLDALMRSSIHRISVRRVLPHSFSLNRQQKIQFVLENHARRGLQIDFIDVVPNQFEGASFPINNRIEPEQSGVFEYSVIPKRRGEASFAAAFLLIKSVFGYWQFVKRAGPADSVRVYPDFTAIANSLLLGIEQNMRYMGAHITRKKGDGMEFNQLREFRAGDTLKQVDWKATARLNMPISREYQEEKDQNIIFLLDCSRRMRATEDNLSYFDYALNALLMSSYIALDKGDAVGVMSFSGEPSWFPPVKGKTSINQILNHLYALHTSTQSSDYVEAAEQLLLTHHKRSLVIFMTNVRDEDKQDLELAVELLSKHHIVMVVALQERILSQVNQREIQDEKDAMLYAGAKYFAQARNKMLSLLKAKGISVVDATHKNIHVKLVSEYLLLKQSGRI